MAIETRDLCGFNNGLAKITYSFDNGVSTFPLTELRFINNGPRDTFNVNFLQRSDRTLVQAFSHAANTGADLVLPRSAPGQQPSIQHIFGGDLFMVEVTGHDGSTGRDFPFFVECWSS